MQHHAPHHNPAFEGYYSKFDLTSGSHVVLVISKVTKASTKGNALTFTYIPKHGTQIYQKIIFVDTLKQQRINDSGDAFILDIPGYGYAKWNDDETSEYYLEHEEFSFQAKTSSRVPWPTSTQTPEGLLVHLPLPLHWHVQSLASECELKMKIAGYDLPEEDISSRAIVHEEKNWAQSFPSAHMWVQARKGSTLFSCAGGEILGMKAFLLGYRSGDLNVALGPPFALRLPGLGPLMSYTVDWETRSFELSVQSLRQKVTVRATAPKGTFFSLAAPFAEGHRPNFLGQSMRATVEVKIYESGWVGSWRLIREDIFDDAGLEFGADYYPPAGSEQLFN